VQRTGLASAVFASKQAFLAKKGLKMVILGILGVKMAILELKIDFFFGFFLKNSNFHFFY